MGKAGRIFCIAVPLALSIISLIFLVLMGLGQTNKDSNFLSNVYYMKADLSEAPSEFKQAFKANNETADDATKNSNGEVKIYNYYTVGLWNYCAGDGDKVEDSEATLGQDEAQKVSFCTGRDVTFAFDPRGAWGIDSEFSERFFNDKLNSALDKYQDYFSRAIGPLYIVTVGSAAITILVSIGAVFSRIGSMATSISCSITTLLTFINAVVVTAAYALLVGAFNTALRDYDVKFSLGPTMLAYTWLTFATSLVAGLFWSLSSCCCSGKSGGSGRSKKGGKYQNLHGGEAGYPMQTGGWSGQGAQAYGVGQTHGAYEPYRQH